MDNKGYGYLYNLNHCTTSTAGENHHSDLLPPPGWPLGYDNLEAAKCMLWRRQWEYEPLEHSLEHQHYDYTTAPVHAPALCSPFTDQAVHAPGIQMTDVVDSSWQSQYPQADLHHAYLDDVHPNSYPTPFGQLRGLQGSYLPVNSATTEGPLTLSVAHLPIPQYATVPGPMESMSALAGTLNEFPLSYSLPPALHRPEQAIDISTPVFGNSSPTGSYPGNYPSSGSDGSWSFVQGVVQGGEYLHVRTFSDSKNSESSQPALLSGSYDEAPFHFQSSPTSDSTDFDIPDATPQIPRFGYHGLDGLDGLDGYDRHDRHDHDHDQNQSPASAAFVATPSMVIPSTALMRPMRPRPIFHASSESTSPIATTSPLRRRKSTTVMDVTGKTTKAAIKKAVLIPRKDSGDKAKGKRRGPLRPDQREQAHEIRKVRACLRCKFLKKTCNVGDTCAGCRPSHTRLWQVPCTRIDIKNLGYFMKDWSDDFEAAQFPADRVKSYSLAKRTLSITHGYGHHLEVKVQGCHLADDQHLSLEWVETIETKLSPDALREYESRTGNLSAGAEGVSFERLTAYIDLHLDENFDDFVDDYFEKTPFVTEILHTAHTYFRRTNSPIVREGLRLVAAYALTTHITMVDGLPQDEMDLGRITNPTSKYCGKTVAPLMVNYQVKYMLAAMWRGRQNDVLEELSSLFSSVYQGDKLKNWPTIFILASLMLAVWELMQYDSLRKGKRSDKVEKFCNDMEGTPVGVIVGLFHAISQKVPDFTEWDTRKHSTVLADNPAICDALTEVREHILRHEQYLTSQLNAEFKKNDVDSLSNKFLSKLVNVKPIHIKACC